ncbi:wax ester/triacylglycerol synthase family O-acyltransferase [Smaragdicoccus niigatensis]|uniref:wax ester/triacylglycerol synthase family O-acyltransferase n=1 Tax=Smaragdicoccus niigatensis TaxID=359359 RepID=UPI00037E1834|nr:wax ester/triacylglycerol synthase family O-acyltransferase [Smaragdicoccus niigatensis]
MARLSELQSGFLKLETPAQLLHVCYVAELDPATITGGYSFAAFQPALGSYIRAIPGARSKVFDSLFNLDTPVLADDDNFDIDRHCHRITVPAPGEPEQLSEAIAHIAGQPLDRSRALWEAWVIEGSSSGHIVLLMKIHLTVLSGDPDLNIFGRLCSATADAELPEPVVREQHPNPLGLALGGLFGASQRPVRALGEFALSIPQIPGQLIGSVRRRSVPLTPFNRTITGRRNVAYLQLGLKEVDVITNAFGVRVNDVIITLVARALRMYLEDRGELPSKALGALETVAIRNKKKNAKIRLQEAVTTLHSEIDDPIEQLSATVAAHESSIPLTAVPAGELRTAEPFTSPGYVADAMRAYTQLRLGGSRGSYNLLVANVPGPQQPMYLLGARMVGYYALGPVLQGAGLTITVTSLEDKLNVALIASAELVPDLWSLADAFSDALDELAAAADATP